MDKLAFEQTVEDQQEEQAAFSAVFNTTDEAAAKTEPEATVTTDEEEPAATQPEEEVTPESPKLMTMDDVNAILATQKAEQQKTFDRIFGTVGDLKARAEKLEAFQIKVQGLNKRQQDKLAGEFPELAAIMFDDSEEDPPEPAKKETQHVVVPDPVDNGEVFEKRLLKRDHPDWEQVVRLPEFEVWRQTLDPATAVDLLSSSDADFISPKLTEFKAWKTAQATKGKQLKNQLDAAVNPRGTPRSAVAGKGSDDEETAAFKAAFKKPR